MRTPNILTLAIALVASSAAAHGPAIQATVDAGRITTREILVDHYEPLTAPKSVYVMPAQLVADVDFGSSWRATPDVNPANPFGPGIAYGLGATFPTNSTLTLTFLEELKRWDGSAFVSAGATELALLRTSNPGATSLAGNAGFSGGADPSATITIGASYTAEGHSQTTYVLLGDGVSPASAVADGVYLAKLDLASSDAGIEKSDPFYLVLNKGAGSRVAEAVASLGFDASAVQHVPEPSAAVFVAIGALALARRRRD